MKSSKGFTLIELMIVAAIIAIVLALAVPVFVEKSNGSSVSHSRISTGGTQVTSGFNSVTSKASLVCKNEKLYINGEQSWMGCKVTANGIEVIN